MPAWTLLSSWLVRLIVLVFALTAELGCAREQDRGAIKTTERAWADLQFCLFGTIAPPAPEFANQMRAHLFGMSHSSDDWPKRCTEYASQLSWVAIDAHLEPITNAATRFAADLWEFDFSSDSCPEFPECMDDLSKLASSWTSLVEAANGELSPAKPTRVPPPPSPTPPLLKAAPSRQRPDGSAHAAAAELAATLVTAPAEPLQEAIRVDMLTIPNSNLVALRPHGLGWYDLETVAIGDYTAAAWVGPYGGVFLLRTKHYGPAQPIKVFQLPPCLQSCSYRQDAHIGLARAGTDVVLVVRSNLGTRWEWSGWLAARIDTDGKATPLAVPH